ncbi:hypothetical protein GCM10009128_02580 [Psychrosphaera haliotis]|uniref:hypothetical protein n=1 Tax=Psychrosphaera haliotis TaxID=555083 RepID=UPI0031D8D01E
MSKLDKDQVLSDFTAAYVAKNGKEPSVEVKSGWYSIDGGKNVRLAAIEEMTQELSGSAPSAKAAEPAKAKKSVKKAAPASKVAEAKSAGFKVVKKGDGYNPANFWLDYLASLNSDSRTPQGFY